MINLVVRCCYSIEFWGQGWNLKWWGSSVEEKGSGKEEGCLILLNNTKAIHLLTSFFFSGLKCRASRFEEKVSNEQGALENFWWGWGRLKTLRLALTLVFMEIGMLSGVAIRWKYSMWERCCFLCTLPQDLHARPCCICAYLHCLAVGVVKGACCKMIHCGRSKAFWVQRNNLFRWDVCCYLLCSADVGQCFL